MLLQQIIIFILFLGPLVFFHELGHFLFARFFGVRVEVFSIGFGPKILKFKKEFTEYAISIIPLGGYVKMYGDDILNKDNIPPNKKKISFVHQSKWARFWIAMGGPLANFILAFVIFMSLLMVGETVPEMRLGELPQDSLLYQKGFRSGDIIQKINAKEAVTLTDMIFEEDDIVKTVTVKRLHSNITLSVNMDGQNLIKEFSHYPPILRPPIVINQEGRQYSFRAVQQNADTNLQARPPLIEEIFHMNSVETLRFYQTESTTDTTYHELNLPPFKGEDILNVLRKNNYYPIDLVVDRVQIGGAADKGGVKPKDIILSLNQMDVHSFSQIRNSLQKIQSKNITLTVLRDGQEVDIEVTPYTQKQGNEEVKLIGIYSSGQFAPPQFIDRPSQGILLALTGGLKRTWLTIVKTVDGLKKLIFGDIPFKQIGGPISIGKVASDSFDTSFSYFFQLMALISVNLGVINLLPIPILDGGHVMFIILEALNRGPLSERKIEIAQRVGLSIILMLMIGALFNDFSRFF